MFDSSSEFYGPSTSFTETESGYNFVTLGFKQYTEKLLPPPYSTACYDYSITKGIDNKGHCYQKCLLKKMKPHEVYPFDVVISPDKHNLTWKRFVPPEYPDNVAFMKQTQDYREDCRKKCRHDCHRSIYVPITESIGKNDVLSLVLYASREPNVRIKAQPTLGFIDFATYILSCVGFWFSWSPVSLIPSKSKDKKIPSKVKIRPLDSSPGSCFLEVPVTTLT